MRMRSARITLLLVLCVSSALAITLPSSAGRSQMTGIREHLTAFQRIADANGGTRLAGTAGYDASARYVADRLRKAGYRVSLQSFTFQFTADRSPPTLRIADTPPTTYRAGRDYATLAYSGSGRVDAAVVAIDLLVPSPRQDASTSGCEAADFAGFPRGAVALVQRGSCFFRVKVANAVAAGASAVVAFNEGGGAGRELFRATLGPPQAVVPALSASFELGDALRNGVRSGPTGTRVVITADVVAERRRTSNVIGESRSGDSRNVVVVGAHLDSVAAGPGINDNGSGSAVVLEAAERLASVRSRNRLRFVWWGAEELGLLGSRHYVGRLSGTARRNIALYLNFDMVGSRNFARFVYDGDNSSSGRVRFPPGSAAIERVFSRYFRARGLAYGETSFGGSDHLPFVEAGIPAGGLFTGADGRGDGGRAHDPCYHRACDTISNVSWRVLRESLQVALHAIKTFARDTTDVRRRR
jgi:Zn-dependent M28 family amino/carboxypeptidase